MMMGLIQTLISLALADDPIASTQPYVIPFQYPPSTEIVLPAYGDTLYTEVDGDRFVYHVPSGAKIYNPTIYDPTKAFQVFWNQKSIEIKNYRSLLIKVSLPSPQIPTIENLIQDYVIYLLPGMTGGYYYANQYGTPGQPGWQTLGYWPPPEPYASILKSHHNVPDFSQFNFATTLRNVVNPSIQTARIKTNAHSVSTTSIHFWPHTINPDYSFGHTMTVAWAGPWDLNVDGLENAADSEVFETWYVLNDSRADWNEDGTIDETDRELFLAGVLPDPVADGSGSSGSPPDKEVAAACQIDRKATFSWPGLVIGFIFCSIALGLRRRPSSRPEGISARP